MSLLSPLPYIHTHFSTFQTPVGHVWTKGQRLTPTSKIKLKEGQTVLNKVE